MVSVLQEIMEAPFRGFVPWFAKRRNSIIEHVAQNRDELDDDGRIEPAAFRASLARLGVDVRMPAWRVRHLSNCVICGIESRHFVVEGPGGPVSYVILPGAGAGGSERVLDRDGLHGLFMQRGGAAIGVFAQGAATREELERRVRDVLA
jgi:hypothetical protein